jgi:hypothetical protein
MRRIGREVVSRDNDSAVIGYSVTFIILFLRSWVFGNTFIMISNDQTRTLTYPGIYALGYKESTGRSMKRLNQSLRSLHNHTQSGASEQGNKRMGMIIKFDLSFETALRTWIRATKLQWRQWRHGSFNAMFDQQKRDRALAEKLVPQCNTT